MSKRSREWERFGAATAGNGAGRESGKDDADHHGEAKLLVGPSGAAVGKELRSAGVTEAEPRRLRTGCISHVGSREQAEFRQRASPHHLLFDIWRKQQSVRVIHTLHCIPPQSAPDAIGQTW